MSTTGDGPPAGVPTLIFDVLGTVVDEAGSVAAETARALAAAGAAQAEHVATEWTRRVEALTGQVAPGETPWRSNDALRREALLEALRTAGPGGSWRSWPTIRPWLTTRPWSTTCRRSRCARRRTR